MSIEIQSGEGLLRPRDRRLDLLVSLIRIAKWLNFAEASSVYYVTPLSHSMESWREEFEGIINTPAGHAYCIVSPEVEYDADNQSHIAQIVFENDGKPLKYDFFVRQEAPKDAMSTERFSMSQLLGELYYDDLEDDEIRRPLHQTVEIYRDLPPLHQIYPEQPELDRFAFLGHTREAECIGDEESQMLIELLAGTCQIEQHPQQN